MANLMSALFFLLWVKSNSSGGTQKLRNCTEKVKEAVRNSAQGDLKVKLEQIVKKMEENWVAKTPGTWRPYVMCCLELVVEQASAEHVLADVERIDHAKKTMRISTDTTKRIRASMDQKKPQSVLKQLLKRRSTNSTALCVARTQTSASASRASLLAEKPTARQNHANFDAATLIRAVMSCPWPTTADERPGSAHLLAVAHAIGWDMSTFDEHTDLVAELRKRYRFACLLCHPDKCSELGSLQAFLRIQTTSETLQGILCNVEVDLAT